MLAPARSPHKSTPLPQSAPQAARAALRVRRRAARIPTRRSRAIPSAAAARAAGGRGLGCA